MTGEHSRGQNSLWLLIAISWLSQWVLWLAYADSVGIREVVVGAVVSLIATWAAINFRHRTGEHYKLRYIYLRQIINVPEILFSGTWILFRVVAIRLFGGRPPAEIVAVRFRVGGNGPSSRGRRALAITYLTFAPNNLVMGFLRDKQLLFFHTVIPQPLPSFMFKMGARLEASERKAQ